MRERNAHRRARTLRGGDAGHHVKANAGLGQGLHFLAPSAKDVTVATLQAHHIAAAARQAHHQLDDLLLRQGVTG